MVAALLDGVFGLVQHRERTEEGGGPKNMTTPEQCKQKYSYALSANRPALDSTRKPRIIQSNGQERGAPPASCRPSRGLDRLLDMKSSLERAYDARDFS